MVTQDVQFDIGNYTEGSSSGAYVGDYDMDNVNWGNKFDSYQERIYNVTSLELRVAYEPLTKVSNLDASTFYTLLEAAKVTL